MATLENLIVNRLNDVQQALLIGQYQVAFNALNLLWSLIPDDDVRDLIEEKKKEYQEAWARTSAELTSLFNQKEYDSVTRKARMDVEESQYMIDMINGMAEYTTSLLIKNNIVAREPSVP